MATQYSPKLGLSYPAASDRNWDVPLVAALLALDSGPLGKLAPRPATFSAGVPSGLTLDVAAGPYLDDSAVHRSFAGGSVVVTPSATTKVWLVAGASTLSSGSAWPTSTAHVRIATVVAGSTNITSVTDERVFLTASGS